MTRSNNSFNSSVYPLSHSKSTYFWYIFQYKKNNFFSELPFLRNQRLPKFPQNELTYFLEVCQTGSPLLGLKLNEIWVFTPIWFEAFTFPKRKLRKASQRKKWWKRKTITNPCRVWKEISSFYWRISGCYEFEWRDGHERIKIKNHVTWNKSLQLQILSHYNWIDMSCNLSIWLDNFVFRIITNRNCSIDFKFFFK